MERIVALTYRRVSTFHQERGGVSLDAQDKECVSYIGRQPGWVHGGDFCDVLTGRTAKRKDYQRLLERVRQLRADGEQVAVITAALDRMGRDLEESIRSRRELKSLNVSLHAIREGGMLTELQANVLASVAQDESELTSLRVRKARQHLRDLGFRPPSRTPWGYVRTATTDAERQTGAPSTTLRVDALESRYVRELFERVADGESVRQAANWAKGLPSDARGGRLLDQSNARKTLGSPVYIGRVAPPKRPIKAPDLDALTLPRGRWEALVNDETWAKVQEQIASHQRLPKQARGEYLLSGLV